MTQPITPQGRTVRAEIRTTASPESVWSAISDPEKLSQWFVDRAHGAPRRGHTQTWVFEKFGLEIPFEVLVADTGRRYMLGPGPGAPPFLLDISLERVGGQTIVRLENSGFREDPEADEEVEGVSSGWTIALQVMRYYLERHEGRPKTSVFAMRPGPVAFHRMLPWFTAPDSLARWLTLRGRVGLAGEPVALALRSGRSLTGSVLAVTSREVAMTWDEMQGVFELKAFSMGTGKRIVGLRLTSWASPAPLAKTMEAEFDEALEMLVKCLYVTPN